MLRAPTSGRAQPLPFGRRLRPAPPSYRLDLFPPLLSGRVGACPRPDHRFLAKSVHMFIGSLIGGATLFPSRASPALSPCSGLVAWLCANKGAPPRLPFLPAPAPNCRVRSHSPPRWGRAVSSGLRPSPFLSASALCQRFVFMAVSHRCSSPMFASHAPAPSDRQLKTFFIGYRLVLRAKQIPSPNPPATLKNASRAHPVLCRGASPPDAYNCSLRSQSPAMRVK